MNTIKSEKIKIVPIYKKQSADKVKEPLAKYSIPDDVWQTGKETTIGLLLVINTAEEKYIGFLQIDRNPNNKREAFICFSLDEEELKDVNLGKLIKNVTVWAYDHLGVPVFCIDTNQTDTYVTSAAKKAGYTKKKEAPEILMIDKDLESSLIELISII